MLSPLGTVVSSKLPMCMMESSRSVIQIKGRFILTTLASAVVIISASAAAQTVSIPDPGFNAAIRSALHITNAPLTVQDLLTLTNLDASHRNIRSTVGLEEARNLASLNLGINLLTNFSIPTTLTNLSLLDLTGNGLSNFSVELSAKRLEYLKEVVPNLSRVALLVNPSAKISDLYIEQAKAAGPKLGITAQAFQARSLDDLEGAFDAMTKADMQAVVVNAESLFYVGKTSIANLAATRRLPTCVWVRECAEAGALLSYGTDQRAIARRTAAYVARILKGEKPAEIPVEQPTRFELTINLKTAKALGLTVPFSLLTRADHVIE